MFKKILVSTTFTIVMALGWRIQAQIILDDQFQQKMDRVGVFFMEPVEGKYKALKKVKRPFQRYDFTIRSRQEKMEIRYLIEPWQEHNPLSALPQVRASQLVMHLASNQEEGVIIGQNIGEETLLDDFNADWGKVFFFEPKDTFSQNGECKLLVLHKGGAGTAYVFFLYDKITTALDKRFLALQFK